MRLIDVDKIPFRCAYEGDCMASDEKCENCSYYVCDYKEIQNQPTAYDVEKVVAELESLSARYGKEDFAIKGIIVKAIDIVKGGVE